MKAAGRTIWEKWKRPVGKGWEQQRAVGKGTDKNKIVGGRHTIGGILIGTTIWRTELSQKTERKTTI